MAEDAFPAAPAEHPYGYMTRRKLNPVETGEDLVGAFGNTRMVGIPLVWTPETERMVPPSALPLLSEAFEKRVRDAIRTNLKVGWLNFVSWGALAGLFAVSGPSKYPNFAFLNWIILGVLPLVNAYGEHYKLKTDPQKFLGDIPTHRYVSWVVTRRIVLSWILLSCVVAIFFAQLYAGMQHSVDVAGLVKPAVRHGEVWRMLTGPLLHGSLFHVLFNGLALLGLGRLMEVITHRAHLAAVFLTSMLCGSLFSFVLLPGEPSVGISGGIMGVIGFLAVLGYRRRHVLPPNFLRSMLLSIGYIVVIGVVGWTMIDNAAHLGGLVMGVALGFVLVEPLGSLPLVPSGTLVWVGRCATGVILAGVVGCLYLLLRG